MNEEGLENEDEETAVIEDARKTKFYFRKMQMVEGGAFVFALISMLISVIEYDMRFHNYNIAYINTLLILISLSTVILGISVLNNTHSWTHFDPLLDRDTVAQGTEHPIEAGRSHFFWEDLHSSLWVADHYPTSEHRSLKHRNSFNWPLRST